MSTDPRGLVSNYLLAGVLTVCLNGKGKVRPGDLHALKHSFRTACNSTVKLGTKEGTFSIDKEEVP